MFLDKMLGASGFNFADLGKQMTEGIEIHNQRLLDIEESQKQIIANQVEILALLKNLTPKGKAAKNGNGD